MSASLTTTNQPTMALVSAQEIRARVNAIQEVMQAVMKEDVHYGKIPGTPKPTLFKPGAEVLCATFSIAPSYRIEDLSTADHVRYRITCVGTHQQSSTVLGEGVGECSTGEEKYCWRAAVCSEEFDDTPVNLRRVKYAKVWNEQTRRKDGVSRVQQIRTQPADLANTVLKMACKRAHVAMTLNVTAASDIFTQDIEDLPDELRQTSDTGGQQASSSGGRAPAGAAGPKGADKDSKKSYTPEGFATALETWGKRVADGMAIEEVLAVIGTRYQLTEDQRAQITALATKKAPAEATQ